MDGWAGMSHCLIHSVLYSYSKVKYTDRCAADERTLREQQLCHQSCWQLACLVHGSDTSGPGVSLNRMFTILHNGVSKQEEGIGISHLTEHILTPKN